MNIHRLRNNFKEQNCKSENVLEELQEDFPALKPKNLSKIMDELTISRKSLISLNSINFYELTISEEKIDVDQFLE